MMPLWQRYRFGFLLVLTSAIALGAAMYLLTEKPTSSVHFTRAQYDQINFGMTEPDLRSIFGWRAGDYKRRLGDDVFGAVDYDFMLPSDLDSKTRWIHWASDTARICIRLDNGRVGYKEFSLPVSSAQYRWWKWNWQLSGWMHRSGFVKP